MKIVKNDYMAFLTMVGGVIFGLMGLAVYFGVPLPRRDFRGTLDPDKVSGFLIPVFGLLASVCIVFFIWRMYFIKYVVKFGFPCEAIIASVEFFGDSKDRGRIEYYYEVDGVEHTGAAAVMRSKETDWRRPGDQITLLVHPVNHSKSVMASVFLPLD